MLSSEASSNITKYTKYCSPVSKQCSICLNSNKLIVCDRAQLALATHNFQWHMLKSVGVAWE